ncbi:MAG: hypothetical protein Tsb0016_12520 [Sphingomonadales bacterium]
MDLFWLKLFHTVITIVNSAAVCYMLYCGLTDRRGPLLTVSLALIGIEVVALMIGGLACPLQLYARYLAGSDGPVDDTFLPHWMAGNIVEFFTPITILAVALLLRNHRRRIHAANRPV